MKDYYATLGVSADASQEEIKSAYRRQAKKCHPDSSGKKSCEPFLAVREAYEVLGDPQRRRDYDAQRERARRGERLTGRRGRPEPLRPERRSAASSEIHVQVQLTWEQVLYGGRLRLWLPALVECPACGGWGSLGFLACPYCRGRGVLHDEAPLDIAFPAGLSDGAVGRVALQNGLILVLHFQV